MGWVYFLGEARGDLVKIGYTNDGRPLATRVDEVNGEQTDDAHFILLAAVRGTRTQEQETLRYFEADGARRGRKVEYFHATAPIVEYTNWLRQQWWVTLDATEPLDDVVEWTSTQPDATRRVGRPTIDPDRLFQAASFHGDLAGTAWDWLSTPEPIGEDYYTPAPLVRAARDAMGGIDLDPASHWRANREHRIPTWYNVHRSAFHNPWFGRVWLNPPYGDNAPWFNRIMECADEIEQLCFLSPAWVFAARQALPFMERSSAAVILTPTPSFWGHPSGRTGTNHPHFVVYMGDRPRPFIDAFRPFGIPASLDLQLAELA